MKCAICLHPQESHYGGVGWCHYGEGGGSCQCPRFEPLPEEVKEKAATDLLQRGSSAIEIIRDADGIVVGIEHVETRD